MIVSMLIKMYSSASVSVPFWAGPHPSTTAFPPNQGKKGKKNQLVVCISWIGLQEVWKQQAQYLYKYLFWNKTSPVGQHLVSGLPSYFHQPSYEKNPKSYLFDSRKQGLPIRGLWTLKLGFLDTILLIPLRWTKFHWKQWVLFHFSKVKHASQNQTASLYWSVAPLSINGKILIWIIGNYLRVNLYITINHKFNQRSSYSPCPISCQVNVLIYM